MKLPAIFGHIFTRTPSPGAENAAFVSFQTLPAHYVAGGGRLNQMQIRATEQAQFSQVTVPLDSIVGYGATVQGQTVSQALMLQNNSGD